MKNGVILKRDLNYFYMVERIFIKKEKAETRNSVNYSKFIEKEITPNIISRYILGKLVDCCKTISVLYFKKSFLAVKLS